MDSKEREVSEQLSIMTLLDGNKLAEVGLELALQSAENNSPGWKERCWLLFLEWLCNKPQGYLFQVEDFRAWVSSRIEPPPSLRSYGFIGKRGIKENVICFNRITKVTNPKAHGANASEYRVIG